MVKRWVARGIYSFCFLYFINISIIGDIYIGINYNQIRYKNSPLFKGIGYWMRNLTNDGFPI